MWWLLLTIFLAANAIFWGLFTHTDHCKLIGSIFPNMTCPPHYMHIIMGALFFVGAIAVQQREYLFQNKS